MSTDEEILNYAERRVRSARAERGVLAIMGTLMLAGFGALLWLLYDRAAELGESLPALASDPRFLAGFAFGILVMVWLLIAGFGTAKLFRLNRGIELEAYELLLKLSGRQPPGKPG
jgi:hypothetical protein